jgi:hypothetical protein
LESLTKQKFSQALQMVEHTIHAVCPDKKETEYVRTPYTTLKLTPFQEEIYG